MATPARPVSAPVVLPGQHWYGSHRADPRGLALYQRHYSAAKNAPYRQRRSLNFVAAGSPLVLLTTHADACFVWLRNTVERMDKQQGICCTLFRNESSILSSELVREADQLAWSRWPDEPRHFTYVDADKTKRRRGKQNPPGQCFLMAGWRQCGWSAKGLVILECLPEAAEVAA